MREEVADLLGWTVEDVKRLSLQSLRAIVQGTPASKRRDMLVEEITLEIRTGRYIIEG